ncbi:MAG TPA: YqcC family protein [Verrucomicrobiae bacterium]|nr:YqcC family protein [Verrucomicrobiae bacterium]
MSSPLSDKLDQVEAEMKRIGYWQENPPDLRARYASGELQSYLDAPSFELWLQVIFLPNAREAVQTDELPSGSQVGTMALRQYDYHSSVPEAGDLVRLLNEFDDLVIAHNK